MKVVVTNYQREKKIQAIKGLRGATGLGLKEAKAAIDGIEAGGEAVVEVADKAGLRELDEWGLVYHQAEINVVWSEFLEVLSRFPHAMTVGDLCLTLSPIAEMAASTATRSKDARGA